MEVSERDHRYNRLTAPKKKDFLRKGSNSRTRYDPKVSIIQARDKKIVDMNESLDQPQIINNEAPFTPAYPDRSP